MTQHKNSNKYAKQGTTFPGPEYRNIDGGEYRRGKRRISTEPRLFVNKHASCAPGQFSIRERISADDARVLDALGGYLKYKGRAA